MSDNANIHVEVINLARAQDRRAVMEAEMEKAGFSAQFHPAFYFKDHDESVIYEQCAKEGPWGWFHLPNMAVTISHSLAWERFLASDASYALIMEDDIFIAPELGEWLSDTTWWPEGADIVKLERWRSAQDRDRIVLTEQETKTKYKGRGLARILSRHMGAAGYMLTRAAAQELLQQKPFDMVVDHILFNTNASAAARKLKIYQVSPAMVEQGNEPTNGELYMSFRERPKGAALLRQKIKRGYYEIAYPFSTILKAITGKAKSEAVGFDMNPQHTTPEHTDNHQRA